MMSQHRSTDAATHSAVPTSAGQRQSAPGVVIMVGTSVRPSTGTAFGRFGSVPVWPSWWLDRSPAVRWQTWDDCAQVASQFQKRRPALRICRPAGRRDVEDLWRARVGSVQALRPEQQFLDLVEVERPIGRFAKCQNLPDQDLERPHIRLVALHRLEQRFRRHPPKRHGLISAVPVR